MRWITHLNNTESIERKTKENIVTYQEQINLLAQDWEHWNETIKIIEDQNIDKEFLEIIQSVKEEIKLMIDRPKRKY